MSEITPGQTVVGLPSEASNHLAEVHVISSPLASSPRRNKPLMHCLFSALLPALFVPQMTAQSAQPATGKNGSAAASPSSSGALGFSIESEMLTYRAVQSNSETVACDIAAYLYKVPVNPDKFNPASKCPVNGAPGSVAGIVLLPFDQNVVEALQLWRANVAVMMELQKRGEPFCKRASDQARGSANEAPLAALTPAGSALSLAQGVLGTLATQTEISAVVGTVEDQAFLDGVARQLSALGIQVLLPSAYAPYTMNGVDDSASPFLSMLNKLVKTRDCVIDAAATTPSDKVLAGVLSEMNAFIAGLGAISPANSKATAGNGNPTGSGNTADSGSGSHANPVVASPAQPASPVTGLAAILAADGLAQKLGVDPATGKIAQAGEWQHILLLKALESGGSVTKSTNILGSRFRYSGGAVGTFALLTRDGTLECSGNVFDFGGSVKAKNFEHDLHHYTPDIASQLVFQRGSCTTPVVGSH
jgi:hypothetical protein